MVVQIHGFDWEFYSGQVMPAFAQWLLEEDERAILTLFEQTRCAYEEQFLPDPMQRLRVWPRARAFIQTLPRGPYSRREYQKLCSPLQYTALSDRYLFRHPPQLYQHSNALRSVWGAIVESFCLPWTAPRGPGSRTVSPGEALRADAPLQLVSHGELAALLSEAGLPDLAREVEAQASTQASMQAGTQATAIDYRAWDAIQDGDDGSDGGDGSNAGDEDNEDNEDDEGDGDSLDNPFPGLEKAPGQANAPASDPNYAGDIESETVIAAQGVFIGQAPNLLHLRGWLADISVRAMALFEYLACGRRSMPFSFEAGEPFGAFCGYLMPDEVWQLATCLEAVVPPDQEAAEEDYLNFRYQHYGIPPAFRLIDEVLPVHAADFLFAVRKASAQGVGLISSME
jgi:hypothetical protein